MCSSDLKQQPKRSRKAVSKRAPQPRQPARAAAHSILNIRQAAVAERWGISHRTLERWRYTGQGPRFMKIGGRVVYRVEDIETYETEQLRTSTLPNTAGGAR